jgi:hypothetical protein
MTDDRTLERVARAWLEEGPTRAPELTVNAALLRIASTAQDRTWPLPRRFRMAFHAPASPVQVLTLIVATVLAVGLGAGIVANQGIGPSAPLATPSPSPSESVGPSPSPAVGTNPVSSPSGSVLPSFSHTFASPLFGYSVGYPDRWNAHPADSPWTHGTTISWGGGSVDDLRGADVRLSVASQPLQTGETPASRIQAMVDASPPCPPRRPGPNAIRVGDQIGTVAVNGCSTATTAFNGGISPRGFVYVVVLVYQDRVYDFILDGAVDSSYLEAILATVTLDPATAP